MKTREHVESELDSLETFVIRCARRGSPVEGPELENALLAVHQRIANLSLTGLPEIQIPPVPVETLREPLGLAASEIARKAGAGALKNAAASGLPMHALVTAGQLKVAAIATAVLATALGVPLLMEPPGQEPDASPVLSAVPSGEPAMKERMKPEKPPRRQVPSNHTVDSSSPRLSTRPLEPANTSLGHREASKLPTSPSRDSETARASVDSGSEYAPRLRAPAPSTGEIPGAQDKAPLNPELGTSDGTPGSTPRPRELTQELEELQAAQRELRSGQSMQALDRVNRLDREVPGGALYPERQIIKVLALCALGRQTDARALVARLQDSPSAGVYSARLRNTCVSSTPIADQ